MKFESGKEYKTVKGETVLILANWEDHRVETPYPLEGVLYLDGKNLRGSWSKSGVSSECDSYDLVPDRRIAKYFVFAVWPEWFLQVFKTREEAESHRERWLGKGNSASEVVGITLEESA